jgi:phage I-like protein
MPNTIHLHSALALSDTGEPPEWVQLVPAGTFMGADGRGPYTANAEAILASFRGRAVIDEMHATDHGRKTGQSARAVGWIMELQDRQAEGVWGRVEWTPLGVQLFAERAYSGISPAAVVAKGNGVVLGVLRASLTNEPNWPLKPVLNSTQGTPMDMMEFLRQLLGLEPDADDAAIRSTLQAMVGDRTMQGRLRDALGVPATAGADAVLVALQSRLGEATELAQLRTRVTEMETAAKRSAAEAAVDRHIAAGRGALSGVRQQYVTLHMQNPTSAEEMMAAMPNLNAGGLPANPGGDPATRPLTKEDQTIIELMGLDEAAYRKQLQRGGTGPVEVVTAGRASGEED